MQSVCLTICYNERMKPLETDSYVADIMMIYRKRRYAKAYIFCMAIFILIVAPHQSSPIFGIITLLASLLLLYLFVRLFIITMYLEESVWKRFNSKMTNIVLPDRSTASPVLYGVMGSIGDASSMRVITEGMYGNYNIRLIEQSVFYKPQSKNGNYSREYRVLEIMTNQDFYHVFMDSKRNSMNIFSTAMTILAKSVKHNKKLNVEGDVNKFFKIYIPQAAEFESLITLSPEKLLAIRDFGNNFDIEFVGKSIYIISSNKIKNVKNILLYQDTALELISSLGVNLVRKRSDIDDTISVTNPDVMTF